MLGVAVIVQLVLILEELHIWKERPFTADLPHTHLCTDASNFGWGATIHERIATHRWFTTTKGHIDGKEIGAAIYARRFIYTWTTWCSWFTCKSGAAR